MIVYFTQDYNYFALKKKVEYTGILLHDLLN